MYHTRSRQIARLEEGVSPEDGGYKRLRWRILQHEVLGHAVIVAFLIRYGKPRIGEPLSNAFRRFAASKAWKACCGRFPKQSKYGVGGIRRTDDHEDRFEPYDHEVSFRAGAPLRHIFISSFPGRDEKEKLNQVFQSAPPWLIWFTFADYTAAFLGLDLPDLSRVRRFERSREGFCKWPGFPKTAFEPRPWPDGPAGEPLARTDLRLLNLKPDQAGRMSNRERKRGLAMFSAVDFGENIHWPILLLSEDHQPVLDNKWAHPWVIHDHIHPAFATLLAPNRRRLPPP
jgi:hypothetical protein